MYEFIRGKLVSAGEEHAVVDVHGIGYYLCTPSNLRANFPPIGDEILLYTSFVVREQSHTLYGFRCSQERDLFDLLTTISGIGPKIALALIGHLSLAEFQRALRENDSKPLCTIKGIGKKSADRILIEMRDKLPLLHLKFPSVEAVRPSKLSPLAQDAVSALVNLGHTPASAERRVERTLAELGKEPADLATLLTQALRLGN